jgi:uncharacterized protein YndB with AHSA1/START domain
VSNSPALRFERIVPVPVEHLWKGWTDPEMLVRWFTPAPWVTTEVDIDLRPGGVFRTVMRGPDGERNEGIGCVLVVEPMRRFVWTSALGPGFVPQQLPEGEFFFTGVIELSSVDPGSSYRATVLHANEHDARRHEEMGFYEGWNAALDQLVALYRS